MSPEGLESTRQRAGRAADVGSVAEASGPEDSELDGAKAIVERSVSSVAWTLSISCS